MEPPSEEPKKVGSYKIISYKAQELPSQFKNLIRAPFLNSLRYGNELFKLIDNDAYFEVYGKYIDSLLSRPKAVISLASIDEDTVVGWCFYEVDILHYVWVKKDARRRGVMKSLLPKDLKTFTHVTNLGLAIWTKFPKMRFNPFV